MRHLVWLLFLAACGASDDYLAGSVVTSLPAGDATGSAVSGTYELESLTTDCAGSCSTTISGFRFSACDVGTRLRETAIVTQSDGTLTIDVEDSQYVSRLGGGLFADATFDVGGVRTQLGGAITIRARSEGSVTQDGSLTGVTRLHAGGEGLDCDITAEIAATR
jgi:hypothetical protein